MLLPGKGSEYNRWIFPLVIVVVIFVGIGVSWYMGFAAYESSKISLLDRVNTVAQVIEPESIRLLSGSEADLENPAYLKLKALLTSIRSVNHDIRFLYLNGIKDGKMFFFADSENPESEDYSPPGQVYEEGTDLMYELFETKENGFEFDSDSWGIWISTYAPIVDPATEDVVALVGIDVPAREYILNIVSYGALPLLFTIIIIAILSAAQYVRTRERRLVDQKAEFLFIASHEIRSPLTGIRWAAENILTSKTASVDEKTRATVQVIHQNSIGLINRVNNLLDVAAFESGKTVNLTLQGVALGALVERAVQSLSLNALARKVELIVSPSLSKDVVIRCDEEQIWHVLVNLISNAIKYAHPNTSVVIAYNKEAEGHVVSVTDHGGGISLEEQKHIFDGYHRTSAAKRSQQYGTGLGLYLSRKIAKMHGGDITVSSREGETIFKLKLK